MGAACIDGGDLSYALTQKVNSSIQALVTAHEIAHNLGAQHPEEAIFPAPSPSLMTGRVRPEQSTFSDFSLQEILSYIAQSGSCLSILPPNIGFEARLKGGVVTASIEASGGSYTNCVLTIYGSVRREDLVPPFSTAINIGQFSTGGQALTLSGSIAGRPPRDSQVYLRGSLSCSEASRVSRIQSVEISGTSGGNTSTDSILRALTLSTAG